MAQLLLYCLVLIAALFPSDTMGQSRQFEGEWSKIGTTYIFSFFLQLEHKGNQVRGYFDWKIDRFNEGEAFSESYYKDKIGLYGREYVRGVYDPATKSYVLKGYKKEDPHKIIALDTYRIKIDENGDIGGESKAHGTWNGRINGKAKKDLVLLSPSSADISGFLSLLLP